MYARRSRGRLKPALTLISLLLAASASAHVVVDVAMSFDVPSFVPIAQNFRYRVIADDLNNDNGSGVVVTIALPSQVKVVSVPKNDTWLCTQSKQTVTCSANEIIPGPNPIDITVTAPAEPGVVHATASVQSIASIDLNPANDNAAADVFAFDPAVCMAMTPALIAPEDQSSQPAVVPLAWSAVPGAQSYTIFTATEGASAAAVATSSTNAAAIAAEPGRSEWWVVANFPNCPPVASTHRFFTAPTTLPRPITVFASGFRGPFGLALSPAGDLYVSDESENVVTRVANGAITTVAGALGQAGKADGQFALFNAPHGLTVTPLDGYVFAADTLNNEVRILYTGSDLVTAYSAAGTGAPGLVDDFSDKAEFKAPMGVAATVRGNLYVADTGNNAIRKLTQVPGFIGYYTVSTVATALHSPLGIAVDANENVFVADTDAGTILRNGAVIASGLDHPTAIAIDTRGNLFVTDRSGVKRIAPSGLMSTVVSGFDSLAGIAVDPANNIFVADTAAGVIREIKPAAEIRTRHRAVH